MPEDKDIADFSHRLQLDRPAPPPRPESLRSSGIRPAAQAQTVASKSGAAATAERPDGLAVVAVYEMARGAVCLLLLAVALSQPHWRLHGVAWGIYYVASNGSIQVGVLTPLAVIIDLSIGMGLWRVDAWARWCDVVFKLLAVFGLAAFALFFDLVAQRLSAADAARMASVREITYFMLGLNLALALYLAFSPQVSEAFRKKKEKQVVAQYAAIRTSGT